MVFIPPPHLASASRPSYAEAYNDILAAHRRSPLSAASSVIILVAPDVDALCAAKMFAELFKQDDVMHRIIPLSGIADLERMRDELITYSEVHHASPIIRLGPDSAPSASHPHSLKYRLYPRLAFVGVVW
jgi:cell division control protein 45